MVTITSVKSLADVSQALATFRADAIDADALDELREIEREVKRLLPADPRVETSAAALEELRTFSAELERVRTGLRL